MNKIIISLPLFVTLAAAAIITTPLLPPVYAQSRACPEGFEVNRGVCQAEPTVIAGECPETFSNVDVVAESEGKCITANTFAPASFINACNEVEGGVIEQSGFPGVVRCVFDVPSGETICETGALNEVTGKCEIKPGNRR